MPFVVHDEVGEGGCTVGAGLHRRSAAGQAASSELHPVDRQGERRLGAAECHLQQLDRGFRPPSAELRESEGDGMDRLGAMPHREQGEDALPQELELVADRALELRCGRDGGEGGKAARSVLGVRSQRPLEPHRQLRGVDAGGAKP